MIYFRFRPSQWAVDSVGSSTGRRRAGVIVERPRERQVSFGTTTRKLASIADGPSMRLLGLLGQAWVRLFPPRDEDAASQARRFERQLPNLAAELRYLAASASTDERRSDR